MLANQINVFQVKPVDVFNTYWDLFKQFNKNGILGCEIDIVVADVNGKNYSYQFVHNDDSEIMSSELDSSKVGNIVAIAQEHGKENVNFGVLFKVDVPSDMKVNEPHSRAE